MPNKNNAVINLTSSRSCGRQKMRDINALLPAPISRISSRPQGRDDEGRKDKENVGQVVPEDKKHLIENNSCVVVPVLQPYGAGSEQQHIRTSILLNNTPSSALPGTLSLKGRGKRPLGFTLIELLVVVLIIAILAAIALPQYQKAVKNAKYTRMLSLLHGVVDAQKAYYLEYGIYATSFDELDVSFPKDSALITQKCGAVGWEYDTRYVNDICIVLTHRPAIGVRVTTPAGWRYYSSGFHYLFTTYQSATPGLYCLEPVKTAALYDPHCNGSIKANNAYGTYYKM